MAKTVSRQTTLSRVTQGIGSGAAGGAGSIFLAWLAFAGDFVTKDELHQAVLSGPYAQDSRYLGESINQLKTDYRIVVDKLQSIQNDVTRLGVKLDLSLAGKDNHSAPR